MAPYSSRGCSTIPSPAKTTGFHAMEGSISRRLSGGSGYTTNGLYCSVCADRGIIPAQYPGNPCQHSMYFTPSSFFTCCTTDLRSAG